MNKSRALLAVVLLLSFVDLRAIPPDLSAKPLSYPPHRVIRTCCAFGSNLKIWIIPGVKYNDITSVENLGPHQYLGNANEGNGILYSKRGGFIDMGHLRDQADWTAYLYSQILVSQHNGEVVLNLGREGGLKTLKLHVPADLDRSDAALLASRIAYNLSIWHEIATWFGSSSVPLVSERFSSFSIEDTYSNLLGATLGMKAIESELPYEKAMSLLIRQTLDTLGVVINGDETYMAMEAVRNVWWTRDKHLPNWKMMIERQVNVYTCQVPWLVPGWGDGEAVPSDLEVPQMTKNGRSLENFYELDLKLNFKFPFKSIFASRTNRVITQADFGTLIARVEKDLTDLGYPFR
jgi:hypothetical protein